MKRDAAAPTTAPNSAAQNRQGQHLLDTALARVGRLETVLAATGGTLHDVNNLLTVLGGNLYLLTEAVREDPALLARCRTARNTAQRAGELIRELLNYAREREEDAETMCPARHVRAMEPTLRRGIDNTHQFRVVLDKEQWSVAASAAQFESAVANLVLNAHEAMTASGRIEVRVRNRSLRRTGPDGKATPSADFVCVSVTDNGPGIPEKLLPRVTEPLFTSKPRGQGNGMGLSMVQAFTGRAGGRFEIKSEEGKGTTARMWLPRKAASGDATANLTIPIATLPAGDETVLLVTTDAEARATIAQLLDALGYTVVRCGDHEDALRLAQEHERIALVICERSRKSNAAEIRWLAELRQHTPKVRQLALLDPNADAYETAADADSYLHKPVAVPDLAQSIRAALEKQP